MKKIIRLCLIFLSCLVLTSCEKQIIVNGVEEKETNEILVILANQGIKAYKVEAPSGSSSNKITLYNITVDEDDTIDAMAILNKYGFPKKQSVSLLDIFNKQGLVPSEMEEKIRYRSGKEAELASVIRKIDGVLDANVQLSYPEDDALLSPTEKSKQRISASVYVKHQGIFDDPNSQLKSKVQMIVSDAVDKLDINNVTVITDKARYAEAYMRVRENKKQLNKELVSVFSIIIEKSSLTKFRVFFFSLFLCFSIFLILSAWFSWKLYPLLKTREGIKQIFSMTSLDIRLPEEEKNDKENEKQDN